MITNMTPPRKHPRHRVFLKADQIRLCLLQKCRTQGWLGYHLGISRAYMSQLMTGHRSPSARLRRKMLTKLGGSFEDWFEIRYVGQEPAQATVLAAAAKGSDVDD